MEMTFEKLTELQSQLGWDRLDVDLLIEIRPEHQTAFLELVLLRNSLLRAQGAKKKSSTNLARIARTVDSLGLPHIFRLKFELALDLWVDNQTASALENFLQAEQLTSDPIQKLFSSLNILLCLESLDFDFMRRYTLIKERLNQLPSEQMQQIENVVQQLAAFEARRDFYSNLSVKDSTLNGQPEFFRNWCLSLPYVDGQPALRTDTSYLWEGSYRQRTLVSIWIASDQHGVRVSDAIDRLYLWTWQLMTNWSEAHAQACAYTLNYVLANIELESQSKEDLLLLRNSLGWLLVMFPHLHAHSEPIFKSLTHIKSCNYPVLEAEFDFQNAIRMYGASSLSRSCLPSIAKWPYPSLHKLVEKWPRILLGLSHRLRPRVVAPDSNLDLIVDGTNRQLILVRENKKISSDALCDFFADLDTDGEILLSGYTKRDPLNLIYRTRKLFGKDSLIVRKGSVTRGPRFPQIQFLKDFERVGWAQDDIKPPLAGSKAHLEAAKALLTDFFHRRDIERTLKVSKASANRMIKSWLEENHIFRKGQSKKSIYGWRRSQL